MASVVWQDVDPAVLGLPDAPESLSISDLLDALHHGRAGQSLLAWYEYQFAAALHSHLVVDTEMSDVRAVDEWAQCAARIAMRLNLSQNSGERLLAEAVALRDRLPAVNACLKTGTVTGQQVRLIITRTELIDGQPYAAEVDAAIADSLKRTGSWSTARLRNMVDRIVFRHDPDAVRRRRQTANDDRGFWATPGEDGMAELGATMSVENARIAYETVRALAATVCKHDPRTKRARASDAAFCLLAGERFECLCARTECDAVVSDPTPVQQAHARIIIHVICTGTTLGEEGTDPAMMDGYGVIAADYARDIATRRDTRTRPLNPKATTRSSGAGNRDNSNDGGHKNADGGSDNPSDASEATDNSDKSNAPNGPAANNDTPPDKPPTPRQRRAELRNDARTTIDDHAGDTDAQRPEAAASREPCRDAESSDVASDSDSATVGASTVHQPNPYNPTDSDKSDLTDTPVPPSGRKAADDGRPRTSNERGSSPGERDTSTGRPPERQKREEHSRHADPPPPF